MNDIFLRCVADIIAYLECGNSIVPTSILHTQLVENSKGVVPDEFITETIKEIEMDKKKNGVMNE